MENNVVPSPAKKGTKALALKLIQQIGLARDKVCPICGEKAQVTHHIFTRSRSMTAYLPEAVIGLCHRCHMKEAHNKPKEFKQFMIERLGEDRYYELRRLSYEHVEVMDYGEICERLRNELRAFRRGT